MSELKKILYLEDDTFISRLVLLSFRKMSDIDIRHCASGREAVDRFEETQPDLLLFDVMLPGMDGMQTLAEIRKLENGADIPVIFMTAKAQVHEQNAYMDLGAIGVIVKPFDAAGLCEQVRSLWSARASGKNASAA